MEGHVGGLPFQNKKYKMGDIKFIHYFSTSKEVSILKPLYKNKSCMMEMLIKGEQVEVLMSCWYLMSIITWWVIPFELREARYMDIQDAQQ